MSLKATRRLRFEKGQSAMEVLLSLPFLLCVMLVGVNFGKAFLLKQRAIVAARYASWQSARTGQTSTDETMQAAGYAGDQMKVTYLSGGDNYTGSVTLVSRVAGAATEFLSPIYDCIKDPRIAYEVSYKWRPLGNILADAELFGEHYVLFGDCRYKGGETTMGKISSGLGWLLRAIGF
jgi:hypothetical protein